MAINEISIDLLKIHSKWKFTLIYLLRLLQPGGESNLVALKKKHNSKRFPEGNHRLSTLWYQLSNESGTTLRVI